MLALAAATPRAPWPSRRVNGTPSLWARAAGPTEVHGRSVFMGTLRCPSVTVAYNELVAVVHSIHAPEVSTGVLWFATGRGCHGVPGELMHVLRAHMHCRRH